MNQKKFSWLHLTDMHLGMQEQHALMPRFKERFFKDLVKSHDLSGPWDIVFFTGDFAQAGTHEDFIKVSEFVNELQSKFKALGCDPVICVVPGNHDLKRPDGKEPVVKAFKHWQTDKEIRNDFWESNECEYRQLVNSCFENFQKWSSTLNYRSRGSFTGGLLPGDFSLKLVSKGGVRVGIVGLNTSFLQIDSDDYKGKLAVGVQQFASVCPDISKWADEIDISILLTHHDSMWFEKKSSELFNSEIAPPGMFHAHFCGHLHHPHTRIESIGGSKNKGLRVGASLFGMETTNNIIERIHGYSSGTIRILNGVGTEKIWPRLVNKKHSGDYNFGPDSGYDLLDDNSISYDFDLKITESVDILTTINEVSVDLGLKGDDNVLDFVKEGTSNNSGKMLTNISRLMLRSFPHHENIRKLEQAKFEHYYRSSRIVWVYADWGMGFEGFLSSVATRMGLSNTSMDAFNLVCEEASTTDQLMMLFQKQFGVKFEEFFKAINDLNTESLLVLSHLGYSITNEESKLVKFKESFLRIILDYCPKLNIVVTTRYHLKGIVEWVELNSLDNAQVKTYIELHPDSSSELFDFTTIENLHRHSGGLPMHLDRILGSLKFSSLNDIFQESADLNFDEISLSEPMPKELKESIALIASKEDRISKRSWTLLKVLSILENGQSLRSINRYDSSQPFYSENASQLASLSLLDSIPYLDVASSLRNKENSASENYEIIKILKVPKQVRDIVKSLIPEDEFGEILKKVAGCIFGPRWRDGKIKNVSKIFTDKQIQQGIGNELLLTKLLMKQALKQGNEADAERAVSLALDYYQTLYKHDYYHDCRVGLEEIYHILQGTDLSKELIRASILYGKSLRMDASVNNEAGVKQLSKVLEEHEDDLTVTQKIEIYLNLAIATHDEDGERTIRYSDKVKELAEEDSAAYLQVESILVKKKFTGQTQISKLKTLEQKARKNQFIVLANNIAYSLATEYGQDENYSIKYLNRILETSDPYNIIRGAIKKAVMRLSGNELDQITIEDRLQLSFCYSYCYFQRNSYYLGECHKVIWEILIKEKRLDAILQLFRHSSFTWRLNDKLDLEKEYLLKLEQIDFKNIEKLGKSYDLINLEYFRRRKLEM